MRRLTKYPLGLIVFLSVLLLSNACTADDDFPVTVTFDTRHIYETDVSIMDGEVEINESKFSLEYDYKMFEELPVTLSLDITHTDINESVAVDLPSSLEGRRLGFSTKLPVPFIDREDLFLGIDIYPSMYNDDGDWDDSAFRIPFRTYLIYKQSEEFILVGGASVRIDYDNSVLPILGLIYKPNDRLSFNLASDDPNITYKIDDQTTVFMEFDYSLDEYEITRGPDKGVILKYRDVSTGFGAKYEVAESLEASLSAGGVFGRRLQYEDDAGKVEPDAGVYARAKLLVKF